MPHIFSIILVKTFHMLNYTTDTQNGFGNRQTDPFYNMPKLFQVWKSLSAL